LSWLNPYRWLLAGGLIAALALGYVAWARHMQGIGYDKATAEYTAVALVASEAARAKESAWQAQLTKAQNEATKRQKTLAADADALRTERNGLRDDLAAVRASVPGLTRTALERYANASADVFDHCVREYSGLAQDADRLASQRQTLIDAWPK
jgi:hypothetical protein